MRIDVTRTIWDFRRFIFENKIKALICTVLAIAAAAFGIANALGISEVTRQGLMRFNVFLVIAGERAFFGYFLWRFLLLFLLCLIISLVGFRPAVSWISGVVIALFGFQATYFITIMFVYGGLAILPLMLVIVVPFTLIILCVLIFWSCYIISVSFLTKATRFNEISHYYKCMLRPFLFVSLAMLAIAILEGALVILFTLGITM